MSATGDVLARLDGPAVIRAYFSQHLVLVPAFDRPCYIHVEGAATYERANELRQFATRDPEDGSALAALLNGLVLTDLVISRDGTLTMTFKPEGILRIHPDPLYESWMVMYEGRPWIGLPGGGVG